MKSRHIFSIITAIFSTAAFAAQPVDFGEITPGEEYIYESLAPAGGHYTPAESCVIKTYVTGDMLHAYSDALHTQEIPSSNFYFGSDGEKVSVYNGLAGETIYFYNDLPLDGGVFRLAAGNEEISLRQAYPAPGDTPMSLADNYRLELIFNTPVKCTKCILEAGDASVELSPDIFSATVTLDWHSIVMQWYADGTLTEGDTLKMTITGIRDENDSSNRPDFGDGPGKLILSYTVAAKPSELIAQSNTPQSGTPDFLTYYLPEGEEGLVRLTFDRDLDPAHTPMAKLQYGDIENQDFGMYIEQLPVSIEGPDLLIDFRGVSRLPGEMVPGLPAQEYIYMQVTDIRSADGQHVWTGQLASPYTFGFSYKLKSVLYTVAADWLPLPGSPLGSGDDMEIWVLNGNRIAFDSVDFSYVSGGEACVASVPYADLAVSDDPDYGDARIFNLKAPAIYADQDTDIKVSFGGLLCADGQDHSSDIEVTYRAASNGVDETLATADDAPMFDLQGRRVVNPAPGIYIRGGKKIVVR